MTAIIHPRKSLPGWQQAYAQAITSPADLLDALDLPRALLPGAVDGHGLFPVRVPRGFLSRMERGNPHDPLLRQVLPLDAESATVEGFIDDPVGDLAAMPVPGVLHKYQGRVLLIATGACAVNCRYCFRRHFPYADAGAAGRHWDAAVNYIAANSSIREVILSGGDPLVLADQKLAALVHRLAAIPHLRRLRIHSRLPVVLPERISDDLLAWFTASRLAPVLVLHANHPAELDQTVQAACAKLKAAGITLLNQAVLLRGVNDNAAVLSRLSERLFECGVLPYYLHVLDPVRGASHFEVGDEIARQLMETLTRTLPGYLVPKLVREEPGVAAKTPLSTAIHK
ncbi:MAG: EF-P beta-lysylation protein EpmB [Aquisalimonadaceae bacterium]